MKAIIIAPELDAIGEAVKLRKDTILSELLEPWRANLTVDFLVGFAVTLVTHGNLGNPLNRFASTPDRWRSSIADSIHVVIVGLGWNSRCPALPLTDAMYSLHVEEEYLRHLQHYVGLSLPG